MYDYYHQLCSTPHILSTSYTLLLPLSCSARCLRKQRPPHTLVLHTLLLLLRPLVLCAPCVRETKILEFNKRFYEECRREAQMNYQNKTGNGATGAPPGASTHQVSDHKLCSTVHSVVRRCCPLLQAFFSCLNLWERKVTTTIV